MSLGNSLYQARKKRGLTQEQVAERLKVSRQTISKWEGDETLPDLCQAKKLSSMYQVTLDELVDFDLEIKELEAIIEKTSEEVQKKVDWTQLWSKKYPILTRYPQEVETTEYTVKLEEMLTQLKQKQGYTKEEAFLVLKDILAKSWNQNK